jgi:phosphoribosylanthranilate isomerase
VLHYRRPLLVGVFAGQESGDVVAIAEAAGLDMVQLSGGEDDDYVRRMRLPVIRAVHVGPGMNPDAAFEKAPPGIGQVLMLDTASDVAKGGTGQAFDWSIAAECGEVAPLMLAGGLSPESVAGAISLARPWAVDVSSGVEVQGAKDAGLIEAFVKAAKGVRV